MSRGLTLGLEQGSSILDGVAPPTASSPSSASDAAAADSLRGEPPVGTGSALRLLHAPVRGIESLSGELVLGGVRATVLVRRAGGTPCYAYARSVVDARIREVRSILPPETVLAYALKANPLPALVRHMAGACGGADVASVGEARLALESGFAPEAIWFAGPGKRAVEVAEAVAAGLVVVVESATQLRHLADAARATGRRPRAALRLNPPVPTRGAGMVMTGGPSPFGVDLDQVPGLLRQARLLGIGFEALHLFGASQVLDGGALAEMFIRHARVAADVLSDTSHPWRTVDLGGGFGVPYAAGEHELDLGPVCEGLAQAARIVRAVDASVGLRIELGRYLVAEAGVYFTRVLDRKQSCGRTILVLDGGMHHHLAAAGRLGQVLHRPFPIVPVHGMDRPPVERVDLAGPLCTPLDTLGRDVPLPRLDEGDLIAVLRSGAYGRSASPAGFLGREPAFELLV